MGFCGNLLQADIGSQGFVRCVDVQDMEAARLVRQLHLDNAVEPPRPKQRWVQEISAIGGAHHQNLHILAAFYPVHLGEQLIEGLVILQVAYVLPPLCT